VAHGKYMGIYFIFVKLAFRKRRGRWFIRVREDNIRRPVFVLEC